MNALEQAALDHAIPAAVGRGIGVIGRQVFASGLLTRPVQDIQDWQLDWNPEIANRNSSPALCYAGQQHRTRSRRVSSAVCAGTPGISVALLGVSRSYQLDAALQRRTHLA